MKFTTTSLISLALALSASATPISTDNNAASTVASPNVKPLEDHGLEKREQDPTCLNRGPKENRGDVLSRIDDYCARHQGWVVKDGYNFVEHQTLNDHALNIGVAGTGGCEWTIGIDCYYNLRKPLDQCNTEGEDGKQGGLYGDDCAGYWLTFVDH